MCVCSIVACALLCVTEAIYNSPHTLFGLLCRLDLSFHLASDKGLFAADVLEARKQREAESLQVCGMHAEHVYHSSVRQSDAEGL